MTREEKEQAVRQKAENLDHLSDILLDIVLSLLDG